MSSKAYFHPECPLDFIQFARAKKTPAIIEFIGNLMASIEAEGMRNPVVVQCWDGKTDAKPGRCRCWAATYLDWRTVPAIILDHDGTVPVPEGSVEISPDEIHEHLDPLEFCVGERNGRVYIRTHAIAGTQAV